MEIISEQLSIFENLKPRKIIGNKPIRLIECFGGIGAQSRGLEILGISNSNYKYIEWNYKSCRAYNLIHIKDFKDYSKDKTIEEMLSRINGISADWKEPMSIEQIKRKGDKFIRQVYNDCVATHNLCNIMQVKGKDLEIVETDKYEYIMWYSFPCFTANSLVLTRNGYKRIADVCINDEVLSHDNKYHKVINRFENGIHDIYNINAMGIDEIKTTYNHKFYIREKYRKGHKSIRCFKEPQWKEVKDLTNNDYLGIAINHENRYIASNKLPTDNKNFWWLIGRYIGDGWIRQQGGIIICCALDEVFEITSKLDLLDFNYTLVKEKSIYKIHISKKSLSNFVEQFGKGAGNKHLTRDIIDLPISYLEPFIDGYLSADGCFTNGVYKATSISRELIYGIAQCVAKVYKTPYRIYKVEPPKTKVIEGRLVNQNTWYQLVFKKEKCKQDKAFYEDGYIWYPIKSINYIGKDYVYDIEVEDSHSFTVQNTIVHNCQDLSIAGQLKGMENNQTRSGLLWEIERILKDIKTNELELPQTLIMENVPNLLSPRFKKDFEKWENELTKLGYSNFIKVMDGSDYGIPQIRKRVFMVSILGDNDFVFPGKMIEEYFMADFQEDSSKVNGRYFLSKKIFECFTSTKNRNGFIRADSFNPHLDSSKENVETITCRSNGRADQNFILVPAKQYKSYISYIDKKGRQNTQDNRIYNKDEVGTIPTSRAIPKIYVNADSSGIIVPEATTKGFAEAHIGDCIYINRPEKKKGVVQTENLQTIKTSSKDLALVVLKNGRVNLRALTPKETLIFMGFTKEDYDLLVKDGFSDTTIYHLAGDSIITTVASCIMSRLIFEELDHHITPIRNYVKTLLRENRND